jgi:hypothetical protein
MSSKPAPTRINQYFNVIPSYAMLAGIQLGVFTAIGDDSVSGHVIADRLQLPLPRLQILLYALVACELLTCKNDRFENTPEASTYLVEGKPDYMGAGHYTVSVLWDAVSNTAETIRSDSPVSRLDFSEEPDERMRLGTEGLRAGARTTGFDLMKMYDFSHYGHVADVGGGSAGMAEALTSQNAAMQVTIIELPTVITITESLIADVEHRDRIHLLPMDAVANSIPGTYDAVVMRAFTQVLKRNEIPIVLKHSFDAMSSGGYLYNLAQVVHDTRTTPQSTALFNLVFINVYEEGQAYTESEYRGWLEDAGFVDIEIEYPSQGNAIMRARKP